MKAPFIKRLQIKNYRSIAQCDVALGPLQFLVGRNGSGKSNALDALAFLRDAVRKNLGYALEQRHGLQGICHRNGGNASSFSIEISCCLPSGIESDYGFTVKKEGNDVYVDSEYCDVHIRGKTPINYRVENNEVRLSIGKEEIVNSHPPKDNLIIGWVSGIKELGEVYDALRSIIVHNIHIPPSSIGVAQPVDDSARLSIDGMNILSAYPNLSPKVKKNIQEYFRIVIPQITEVKDISLGKQAKTLRFFQHSQGKARVEFSPYSMSDGTLNTLGVLVALLQEWEDGTPSLVGIEEPETGLHAQAFGALFDAIEEASRTRQVIVTTHSTDMLDDKRATADNVLAVEFLGGKTQIGELGGVSLEMLKEHLTTAGELMRQDEFKPQQ